MVIEKNLLLWLVLQYNLPDIPSHLSQQNQFVVQHASVASVSSAKNTICALCCIKVKELVGPITQVLVKTGRSIEHGRLISFGIKVERRNTWVLIDCHTMRNEGYLIGYHAWYCCTWCILLLTKSLPLFVSQPDRFWLKLVASSNMPFYYHLESKWKEEMHEFSLTVIPCEMKGT